MPSPGICASGPGTTRARSVLSRRRRPRLSSPEAARSDPVPDGHSYAINPALDGSYRCTVSRGLYPGRSAVGLRPAFTPPARGPLQGSGPKQSAAARLGLSLDRALPGVAASVALTALFYSGHLLRLALDRSPPQAFTMRGSVALRNLVFAPVVEELVFRSCVAAALGDGGAGLTARIWASPLFFGVAHLHHAAEELRKGEPLSRVALIVLVQATYTTLFGAYATFLLLRTGVQRSHPAYPPTTLH